MNWPAKQYPESKEKMLKSSCLTRFVPLIGSKSNLPRIINQTRCFSTHQIFRDPTSSDQKQSVISPAEDSKFGKKDFGKLFGVSVFGGGFGGMVGLGGNIVLIPLISQLFPTVLTAKQIVATCLVTVVTAGFIGSLTLYFAGGHSVDIVTSIILALFASMTARFGVRLSSTMQDRTLKIILAFFMIFVAPLVAFISKEEEDEKSENNVNTAEQLRLDSWENVKKAIPPTNELISLFAIGSTIGVMSGLLGVGGGVLIVPALSFLWLSDKSFMKRKDASQQLVIGTSLAAMTVPSTVALYSHWRAGNVLLRLAPILVIGSALGAYSGSLLASKMDENVLKYTFATTMLLLGGRQFIKAIKK